MKIDKFNNLIENMQKKLGKENASKIADDIGTLISDNAEMNKSIDTKDSEINKLKQDKETLMLANGNLLQQVTAGTEDIFDNHIEKNKNEDKKEPFSFKAQFDKNGDFID